MRQCILLAPIFLFVIATTHSLQAQTIANKPLQIQLKIALEDHPTFTPQWKQTFSEELRSTIRSDLGAAAEVEIVFATPEESATLGSLEKLPNSPQDKKIHYVVIRYTNGIFDLYARQMDGETGFLTPVVRQTRTRDRDFLARIAGSLVQRDVGLVGQFTPKEPGSLVDLELKGSARDPRLKKQLHKGDLFAVIQIRSSNRTNVPPQISRSESVLLQVAEEPKDGPIRARLLQRYIDPLPTGPNLQYLAIQLGTTVTPLQLKLLDPSGALIGQKVRVQVHPERFPELPNEGKELVYRDGLFISTEAMPQLACARILLGDRVIARLPIELLEPGVITRTVRVDPQAETQLRYEAMRRDLHTRLNDARRAINRCFIDLTALERNGKKNDALDRATNFDQFLQTESAELAQDLERVRNKVKAEGFDPPGFWGDFERGLELLQVKQTELTDHVGKLREAIRMENDPAILAQRKKVQDLINEAELLVNQADYDNAIARYEQALQTLGDNPAATPIQATLQKLKQSWSIQDIDHGKARDYFLNRWVKLTSSTEINKQLSISKQALAKCRLVGDKLTISRVLNLAPEMLERLAEEVKQLANQDTAEADLKRGALKKLIDDLEALHREMADWTKK